MNDLLKKLAIQAEIPEDFVRNYGDHLMFFAQLVGNEVYKECVKANKELDCEVDEYQLNRIVDSSLGILT